jgi:Fe-S oxidoreductase
MFLSDKEREETIWACRYCPMCQIADRVAQVVRRESYSPRGRAAILFALEKGLLEWDESVADIMYASLNDGMLREWCVGKYDHEELVLDARARIFQKGLAPEAVARFVRDLRENPRRGTDPAQILSEAGIGTNAGSEILVYAGCSVRESGQDTLVSMGRLFKRAEVPFQVLSGEPCCGFSLYQLGDLEGAGAFSVSLARAIRDSGARTIVCLDADCYRMLMGRTVRFGGELPGIRVLHANRVLADWIEEGRLVVQQKIAAPATYHDPCILARYFEDTDSPRKVLGAIMEGELREMATHKKLANCCGAGGMLSVHRPEISGEVAFLRVQEALETGASILATGCTRCDRTLSRSVEQCSIPALRVVNLVDLTAEACGLRK